MSFLKLKMFFIKLKMAFIKLEMVAMGLNYLDNTKVALNRE